MFLFARFLSTNKRLLSNYYSYNTTIAKKTWSNREILGNQKKIDSSIDSE